MSICIAISEFNIYVHSYRYIDIYEIAIYIYLARSYTYKYAHSYIYVYKYMSKFDKESKPCIFFKKTNFRNLNKLSKF